MHKQYSEHNTFILIIISLAASVTLSILNNSLMILLGAVVALFILKFISKQKLIILIILSYLTASAHIYPEYRTYITLISTAVLLYLVIWEFGIRANNYPRLPSGILFFLTLLILTLALSTIFSNNVIVSGFTTLRLLIFLFIVYLFYSLINDRQNIYIYIYAIIAVTMVLGLRMLLDFIELGAVSFFAKSLLSDKSVLQSKVSNTGTTVYFISISFLLAMFFIDKFKSRLSQVILSILLLANIIVLILANSRGGIISAALSGLFILILLKPFVLIRVFIIAAILTLLLLFALPAALENVEIYLRLHAVLNRLDFWETGLRIIDDNMVFGVGPGLFSENFFSYVPSSLLAYFNNPGLEIANPHPHNLYIYYTSENGILGLLTAISFFVVFFYYSHQTIRLTKRFREEYIFSVAITGIGIGVFFKSFFEVSGLLNYGYITTDLPFWLVFGILINIFQKFKNQHANNHFLHLNRL